MTDSTDEDLPACRECGEPVASSPDHRVVTTIEDDEAVYKHFCSDDCLENWDA